MGSSFGTLFRIHTFGESHGGAIGVVIDGCPPRLPLSENDIQVELDRRRPGQSNLVTQRNEPDRAEILSGVFNGYTIGSPIAILVRNSDARPEAYADFRDKFRPSHADFTYQAKYGIRNWQGGGRASARETIARVAAGAVAAKFLRHVCPSLQIVAFVSSIYDIDVQIDPLSVTRQMVEANPVRCPDPAAAEKMAERIRQARSEGDSVGGIICCVVQGLPPGLGEPIFDRLEADLAKAMLSLPATKGFQIGSGFAGTRLRGSQHNDPFALDPSGTIITTTNHSGGVQGGISNGQPILFWTAFKPTATIAKTQQTVDCHGNPTELAARGRHDPCVLPRAVPIVEAMTALVLADHWLRQAPLTLLPPLPSNSNSVSQ